MPIIPRYSLRRPAERREQAAQDDCRDAAPTAQHVRRMGLPFVLQCLLPMQVQRKTLLQQSETSQSSKIHIEKERTHLTWKGEGGTLDYSFMGLDTGLQNPPSFLPPPLPLTSLVIIFCLDSLLPTQHPLPSVRALPRPTTDDSFETRKKRESRDGKPCRRKGSRHCMCMVLITKVQLVGDLYGCAFKLCILHITGNKY